MSFAAYHRQCVGHYLKENKLMNEPIGKLGNILEDITQRAYDSYEAQTKAKKKRGDATPEEIAVYHAYPRQVGRADALAAIKGAREKGVDLGVLLAAAVQYAACVAKWPRTYRYTEGRDMVPYPATWFRAERYLDSPKEWMPAGMFTRDDDPRGESSLSQRGGPNLPLTEPDGWHEEFPDAYIKVWKDIPDDSKKAICDHMNKVRA